MFSFVAGGPPPNLHQGKENSQLKGDYHESVLVNYLVQKYFIS